MVIYKDLAMPYDDYNAKLLVVERVTEALNKEGVPAKQIVGFMGGAKMYIPLADEYDSSVKLPDSGDLIAPNLNTKGELTSYFTCYDFSEDEVYVKNGIEPVKFGEVQSNGDMSEVRTYANIKDTAETSRVIVYTRFMNLKDIIVYK